jgi:hypothetical protein
MHTTHTHTHTDPFSLHQIPHRSIKKSIILSHFLHSNHIEKSSFIGLLSEFALLYLNKLLYTVTFCHSMLDTISYLPRT